MKGKKIIVSALVASMVGAPVAVLGTTSKALADNTPMTNEDTDAKSYTVVGPSVTVKNDYVKEARKNDWIKPPVPVSSVESGKGNTIVTVIDPNGNALETDDFNSEGKFQATIEGTYTYRFESFVGTDTTEANRTSIVSTYELFCEVSGDRGTLEVPDNSYHVVPTEFVKGKTLTVPVPTGFINDDDVDFGSTAVKEVTVNDKTQYAVLKAFLLKSGVSEPIEMDYHASTGSTYDKQACFSYGFANSDAAIGSYKLVYKLYLVDSATTDVLEKDTTTGEYKIKPIYVSNSKTIKVKSALTASDLFISWGSTPKKSAEVGVKYNLVNVNATFAEGSSEYVNAFAKVTVTHEGTGKEMVVDYDDMSFVPTEKGNYFVKYLSVIPSLNIESNELAYSILDVDDSTDPVLYLTGNYYVDADGKTYASYDEGTDTYSVCLDDMDKAELLHTIGDTSHYVKSYYRMQQASDGEYEVTVKIPAAYVTDNFSNAKGIKVTRNLYKRTNTTDSGKLQLINSETNSEYAFNEVAEYTFTTRTVDGKTTYADGNYVVKYVYEDESGQSVTSDFNITVKPYSDTTVKGEPRVTFTYDEEMINSTDKIRFDVPTATDEYDTNLLVETFYGFEAPVVADHTFTNEAKFKKFIYSDVKSNQYELDVKTAIENDTTATDHQYLYLVSVAKNSYDSNLTTGKNFIVKKIMILGAQTDNDAPSYESGFDAAAFNTNLVSVNTKTGTLDQNGYVTGKTALFNQDDIIKIPTIKFNDADNFVNFDVRVTYANGNEVVELNSLETDFSLKCTDNGTSVAAEDRYTHEISGASFRASYAKTYTITVSATDSKGNVSFTSFAVRVNDTQPPVISIENKAKFSTDIEVGTTFTVPAPTVYDNDVVMENPTWYWTILAPNQTEPSTRTKYNRSYTPTVTGTYIIKYYAQDDASTPNENASSEYRLNVVAKDAPVITVAPIEETERAWDYEATTQRVFEIPMASAKDVNFNDPIFVDAPVVKNSKGEERPVTMNESKTMWQFTPDVQGTYTITYSAQGKFLNSTKQLTVNIGDGSAPTLEWENREEDLKTTVKVGDSWTFKFDMIELDDEDDLQAIVDDILKDGINSTSMNELSEYVTITMKNADNKSVAYEIADGGLKYTFDKSGNYTFKLVLKDKAGNNSGNTYSYTITASEKSEADETENDSAIGTVLIVLSVVILAGVVAYFAITTKQVDSKSTAKKADKKDEKKDK